MPDWPGNISLLLTRLAQSRLVELKTGQIVVIAVVAGQIAGAVALDITDDIAAGTGNCGQVGHQALKDIGHVVGVASHQIAGLGGEGHSAAVTSQGGVIADAVRLGSIGIHTDSSGGAGQAIPNEEIAKTVGVVGHQIGRLGLERNHIPVIGNRRHRTAAIRLSTGRVHADPLGQPGGAVIQEDIARPVAVASH